MQYHLLVMILAEYSSSYSLFACHMMSATSVLTLLKLSKISKPLCSSLTLVQQCSTFTQFNFYLGSVGPEKQKIKL